MARCGLALNQRNDSSLAGQRDRSRTARHSTTQDENFVLQRNLIQIGRCNGNLLFPDAIREIVPLLTVLNDQCCSWAVVQFATHSTGARV